MRREKIAQKSEVEVRGNGFLPLAYSAAMLKHSAAAPKDSGLLRKGAFPEL